MKRLWIAILSLFLVQCSSAPLASKQMATPETVADLQWSEAQSRFERLSNIEYDLSLNLDQPGDEYSGTMKVQFDLSKNDQDLRLDFFEGTVTHLLVNGIALDLSAKKPYWIVLPSAHLIQGQNKVEIAYKQKYSKTGDGLHRFNDPEDSQYYLHTQFEPYDANRFMPCFDQPDLRATIKMQVAVPKHWQVITSVMETRKTAKGPVTIWEFPASPKISTYIYSLHAGPYKVFTDRYQDIPLRLFIRPALAKYLDTKEWFKITKQGLAYFGRTFAYPYPFKKYDQLVVPEFNAGGMENVAAVTYTEGVVPRSETTRSQRRQVAGLLLHEMAHMWFGDLVTMKWWNDLWLNESFATLMASMALSEATEFKEAWQEFAAGTKRGAYAEDALSTTHPIEAHVTRVKEAMANFDGITYNKGASVMKQLRYYMTPAAFEKGVQQYFKTHAYQNTQLKDFIASLQAQTDKDLTFWAERWLKQSGTDQIAASWTCEAGRLKSIGLELTPSTGARFRPQSFEVGLYGDEKGSLKSIDTVRVDFVQPEKQTLRGDWACPAAVYPNKNDHAYVNVKLDAKSLESLKKNLSGLDDALVRSLVWNDLWRMVRSSEMSLKAYIETVENNFAKETDQIILRQVVGTIQSWRGAILSYWPVTTEDQRKAKNDFRLKMEENFLARMKASKSGSDDEKFWFDSFLSVSESPRALDQAYEYFKSGRVSAKFPLDPDRRWSVVHLLKRFGHPKANEVFESARKSDPSDRGQKWALAAEAVVPQASVKEKWIQEFTKKDTQRSLADSQAVMYGLFPLEQLELKAKYEPLFYDYLAKNKKSEEEGRVRTVVFGLLPLRCEGAASGKLKSRLESEKEMNHSLLIAMKKSIEEDERCQRIRAAF